eukprot:CAMPEP_0116137848 /NCGR_PEP_ID=MMETSP0329-20121206/12460_1 /TAXON_ID=697910 /ORGANISM="Pseudo-nitzschia arenysensis, Strain B593" /LENGTH=444 /DNA_ID=CAMNT_0003632777 /DNA_START=167 /DNA_END=1501 /DNA_ORIENTATION=-
MLVLNYVAVANSPSVLYENTIPGNGMMPDKKIGKRVVEFADPLPVVQDPADSISNTKFSPRANHLMGTKILIAIAAYDFSQIPHLGEVLDAYQDLCLTGASNVDVVIHATVAYPVTLIDLLNSRVLPGCKDVFSITIVLKPQSLKLHLVDCHRELFYSKIDDYDLFIYTEDDIRVPPRVIGAYLAETKKVQSIVGLQASSDFNVGIVRYEYDFPSNVVMDDKTRHATQNVSRVYWEHGFYPVIGEAVRFLKSKQLKDDYVQMQNVHQGMFLATPFLLKAWKERKNCNFDVARNRPAKKNNPHQPAEGTQRVWMSSKMLYGRRHCGVEQVIPIDSFETLTVLHLPNKNYRRVGRFRNRTFSDGTEHFEVSSSLLTEMKLHVELRNATKQRPTIPYNGVTMVDEVDKKRDRSAMLERRLSEYQAYVDRGGILSADDIGKTSLVEES